MKAKKEPYLDYEIMLLDMKTLKKEVKKCLKKGNEDYLNELFLYGCWANKSELVNSDKGAISKGMSLLHREGFSIFNAIEKNYSGKVIKTLLDGGADPNLQTKNGGTALTIAAVNGRTQAVQELLKHPDIDPNLQDKWGWTALINAAIRGETQAVQELLKHPKINPNLQDEYGRTALMLAAEHGNSQAVRELLKHPDIDPNLKNNKDNTALMIVMKFLISIKDRYKSDSIYHLDTMKELLKHPKTK